VVELLHAVADAGGTFGQPQAGAKAPLRARRDARDLCAAEVEGQAVRLAACERGPDPFSGREGHR
jgi:hypothetical protein